MGSQLTFDLIYNLFMLLWQNIFISLFALFNFFVFIKGFYKSTAKKNVFGLTHPLFFLGMFVWGDAIILGLFWSLTALVCLLLQDWILFLLTTSVFWIVRSLGEILYWINQQFSQINRNLPKTLVGYRWFKNDAIWFIYQLVWQCVLVISIITTICLANLWIKT